METVESWRKSSYSGNGGADCVEVGNADGSIMVRDTKNDGRGPVLGFGSDAWSAFTARLKKLTGRLDEVLMTYPARNWAGGIRLASLSRAKADRTA
jgi:hypothetical protein